MDEALPARKRAESAKSTLLAAANRTSIINMKIASSPHENLHRAYYFRQIVRIRHGA